MVKTSKRPRDANQLAKSIVDLATSIHKTDKSIVESEAVVLGRMGGIKGGKRRAETLSPEERSLIAKKAAKARWHKVD